MADLNKVQLIGRLTRDPEIRTFQNGGKVANFGFAVTGKRVKNNDTGKWEGEPCFLDCKAFNKGGYGKNADLVEKYLAKGKQCYLEGRLQLERWDDRTTGEKKQKIVIEVDNILFLDRKDDGGDGNGGHEARQEQGALPGASW
jgi:single-strand DNA-binding protein